MIIGYRTGAYGYKAKFFYNRSNPLDPVYIVFDSAETVDNFKDGARRLMEYSDGRVWVKEILKLIEIPNDNRAFEVFKHYYWGPEDYFVHPEGSRLTLKFIPPNYDYEAAIFTPRCSGRYPWGYTSVTAFRDDNPEDYCVQEPTNRLTLTASRNDNNEGGITPMNTSNFKNAKAFNAYKTFTDKLRREGADMRVDFGGFAGQLPTVMITTNTVQILRALETIQPFDIPEIIDYKFYADRVTIVKFADGTYTKCEVQGEDKFDPDTGIIFCVVKKMLGAKGHERFNDILRKAHAAHKKVEADKQKAVEEERARKEKAAQARAKKLKREEKRKRRAIDIQKQAYVEAIAEVATTKKVTKE